MKKILFAISLISLFSTAFAASFVIQDVVWTQGVNVTISGNTLTQVGAHQAWNAGAFSSQAITAGKDGYVETTVYQSGTHRMFGLSDSNTNACYNTIDYAIYMYYNMTLYAYENGSETYLGRTYTTSDVLRIAREGNQIKYYQNGVVIRTVTTSLLGNLYADTSTYESGSIIYNAKIAVEGVPEPTSVCMLALGILLGAFLRRRL